MRLKAIPPPSEPGTHGAGVRVPPPLIFAVGFAAGWLLDRWAPVPFDHLWWKVLGWFLVAGGAWLIAWSVLALRRAGTTVRPDRASSALVVVGPFRFSRNPLYLSFVLVYAGAALLTGTLWALVALPLVVWTVVHTAITSEERYLAARFGGTYEDYRRRVRRWL